MGEIVPRKIVESPINKIRRKVTLVWYCFVSFSGADFTLAWLIALYRLPKSDFCRLASSADRIGTNKGVLEISIGPQKESERCV